MRKGHFPTGAKNTKQELSYHFTGTLRHPDPVANRNVFFYTVGIVVYSSIRKLGVLSSEYNPDPTKSVGRIISVVKRTRTSGAFRSSAQKKNLKKRACSHFDSYRYSPAVEQ
jgi:hypothetical protein